jgi:sugar lactone lactonase YvrE
VLLVVAGCISSSGSFAIPDGDTTPEPILPEPSTEDPVTESAAPPTDTATAATGTTGDTGGSDPCLAIPIAPLSYTWVTGPRPSEEFVFTADGWMINAPDGAGSVFRTPYGAEGEVVAPFEAVELAGVRILLDGTVAFANEWDGTVERLNLVTGARTRIIGGLEGPNSLAVGPDGRLYVANYGSIVRTDPATDDPPETLADLPGPDLDGLTFAPDYSRLYFNDDEGGDIGMIELDADGNASPHASFSHVPATDWTQLDGMATDACGNVYVTRTDGELWRIAPDGTAGLFAEATSGSPFTTSVSFGSGVGGWERDHLFMMDRNNGVLELEVGVEGRPEPHLP